MADTVYFVRTRGKVTGPFDIPTLHKLVRRGSLTTMDELSEDRRAWSRAGDYEDLFPSARPTPAPVPVASTPADATSLPASDEAVVATASPASSTGLFFYQQTGGGPVGPVPMGILKSLVQNGTLRPTDLVWADGAVTGAPASQMTQLAPLFMGQQPQYYADNDDGSPLDVRPLHTAPDIKLFTPLLFWCLQFGVGFFAAVGLVVLQAMGEAVAFSARRGDEIVLSGIALTMLSVVVGYIAITVLSVITWMVLHYRCWDILPASMRRTTPGRAVGFLFIPFFNLGWLFISFPGLATDLNNYIRRANLKVPLASAGLGIAMAVLWVCQWALWCVPFVPAAIQITVFILWICYYRGVVRAAQAVRAHRLNRPVSVRI